MSDIKTLKITDLDVEKFLGYVASCDIQEIQIIDFTIDKLKCKAHPSDKSFIKYTSIDTDGLLVYKDAPDGFSLLKFPFYRMKKIRDVLTIYKKRGIKTAKVEISYDVDSDKSFTGLDIKLIAPKLNVKVNATEMYMVSHMSDDDWLFYSNRDNVTAKFDVNKEFITQINNLCNLEGDDNVENKEKNISIILEISKSKNKVVFKSKDKGKWSAEYTDQDGNLSISGDKDHTFYIPKKALESMTAELYDIFIVWNKELGQYVMVMYENDDNIMIKGLMEIESDS